MSAHCARLSRRQRADTCRRAVLPLHAKSGIAPGNLRRPLTARKCELFSACFSQRYRALRIRELIMAAGATVGTNDSGIRLALHAKRLRRLTACPETLIIDELGLAHSRSRIDVAVINGSIHGYEIKSARDTLDRLSMQIDIYRKALQKVTIVAATRHVTQVEKMTPEWCGVIEAQQGPRGGITFRDLRKAYFSPDTDPLVLSHLLWRDEAVEILADLGYESKELRKPRKQLYEMLCANLSAQEITASIRTSMAKRQTWRDHPVHG